MSRRAGSVCVTPAFRSLARSIVPALVPFAVMCATMCASREARAQFTPTGTTERKADPEQSTRRFRSGLVVSLMAGWGIAQTSGYPNDSNKIGNETYFSSSDITPGSAGGLFVGGALADYLNVGFFVASGRFKSKDWDARTSGFGIRVEAFPLVYAVPTLKNLGLFADFGIGSATLDVVTPGYPQAKGVQSFIGVGGMYEWTIFHLFGGHAVAGPTLEYDTVFSTAISSGAGVLGARIAFYGGL
jgi:hypothetical protein